MSNTIDPATRERIIDALQEEAYQSHGWLSGIDEAVITVDEDGHAVRLDGAWGSIDISAIVDTVTRVLAGDGPERRPPDVLGAIMGL